MKSKNKKVNLMLLLLLFAFCFLSPLFQLSVNAKRTGAEISRTGGYYAVNGQDNLEYYLNNKNSSSKYTFIANDPSILSIDAQNKLTALKAGETNVKVIEIIEGKSTTIGSLEIIVKDACLSPSQINLAVNETDYSFISYKNKKATYKITSSNPTIVSTDSKLNILGKKTGKAYITLTEIYKNKSRILNKAEVIVQNPMLRKTTKTIALNEEINPIQDLYYSNRKATYKIYTSDKSIVTVFSNTVGIGKKPGTATITIKETYQKKTRTVATLKVKVAQAIVSQNSNTIEAYIDEPKQIYPSYYVKYFNNLASYSLKPKNTTICKVDEKNYLTPLKKGSTTMILTETYLKKSRILGELNITVLEKPELIEINSYVPQNKNQNGDCFITLLEGVNGDLNTLLSKAPKQLALEFISSNNDVLSIDKNTGVFQANRTGETLIQVLGKNSSLKIAVTVISKDRLPELCEESKNFTTAINTLDANSITQDNLKESYEKLVDTYKIIGKEWPGGDWTDDSHLYTLTKTEHFWKIPNIQTMNLYRDTLNHESLIYVENKNKERKITKLNQLNPTTFEIVLNLPFTEEEFTYVRLNDTESFLLDAVQSLIIYDETGTVCVESGGTNYTSGQDKIIFSLSKPLPKGSYTIKIPSFNYEKLESEMFAFDFTIK